MKKKVLITSALPYANGPLHFGHIAGAYLPGDCYARFERLQGNEVLYLCGSDEYGVAITLSAEKAGRTPQQHVDFFHPMLKSFFDQLKFSFDHYSRTTWPGHIPTVQAFYKDLNDKGFIEEKTENHLYSEKENRFLADRYVMGTCPKCKHRPARGDECPKCAASYEATDLIDPCSALSGSPLILRPSAHLYLRFDKFKGQLDTWIRSKNWKENVVNFAMSYINDLKPRAITRDSDWGVPVPGMPNKVFYVWFDAPIGYVSTAKEWAEVNGKPDSWKDYWLNPDTKLVQFIGKDNIPFHAVFFPAMIMGQDLPYKLPDEIPANEFYLLEGRQFSKSDGWTIDLDDFFTHYSADQIRYCIAANAPETSDSEFTWKDFQVRCNTELLGKFGNFVHRVMTFAKQQCGGKMPAKLHLGQADLSFIEQMNQLLNQARLSYSQYHLRKVSQALMELSTLGNAYFDSKKPWSLAKQPETRAEMDTVIALCVECIKSLSLIASPIMPTSAQKIWELLGNQTSLETSNWDQVVESQIKEGTVFAESTPLFRKVEDSEVVMQVEKLKSMTVKVEDSEVVMQVEKLKSMTVKVEEKAEIVYEPLKAPIVYDQFDQMDLRVGLVLEAVKVPKSKKLLKLTVDLGFEKRTIVSGIALAYEPEQLIGKKVILIANLPPATLMGIESQGMILAASLGKDLELPMIQNLAPGSTVA